MALVLLGQKIAGVSLYVIRALDYIFSSSYSSVVTVV